MQTTQYLLVNKRGRFKHIPGTLLVVQWLGLRTPNAGDKKSDITEQLKTTTCKQHCLRASQVV